MAKPEWGTKRRCDACGAPFYDLNKRPVICPKCSAEIKVDTPPKAAPAAEEAAVTAVEAKAEPVAEAADILVDDVIDPVVADDDLVADDDFAVIEDEGEEDTPIPDL